MKGLAPYGNKSLVVYDANLQYIEFFSYFKDVPEGKNYTFSKSLGDSNIGVLIIIYLLL